MAKIKVEMDTESKTMSLSIDGKDIPGVCYISMCEEDEYMPMSFMASIDETEECSDIKVRKTITASEKGAIKVINIESESVINSIGALLKRK